jgi:hypothetical protein
MSTGGLQAPSTVGEGEDKYIPGRNAWFVGAFAALGVPIFGLALGQLGGLLVDHHIAEKERQIMAKLLTRKEFESVMSLDFADGHDGEVSFTEFALLELIRLGKTNDAQIHHIRGEFDKRDEDHSGKLTWGKFCQKILRIVQCDCLCMFSATFEHVRCLLSSFMAS